MAWVVDTCVIVDVLDDDPDYGQSSALCLEQRMETGLIVSPVTYVELAPAFWGDESRLREFLDQLGARWNEPWTDADAHAAFRAWYRHIKARRQGLSIKRPVADILIGAFASRFEGVITRNPGDFSGAFPKLVIIQPGG
ncbi:MAG TPA: type II toxin-antitoxin system VapC family toxin [Kiritimatiellia bacterium]|nr:type II toxin-antitoxin system VapC family toxin [Kiritimatiellia bacterium]